MDDPTPAHTRIDTPHDHDHHGATVRVQFQHAALQKTDAVAQYLRERARFQLLTGCQLVVHCGGCMLNRREMSFRVEEAMRQGVSVTNYGVLIAYVLGILPRALAPFPAARLALDE